MDQKKYKIILFGSVFLLILIINFLARRGEKQKYLEFYNAKIEGKLDFVNYRRGVTDIVVNKLQYRFVPCYIQTNTAFSGIAKKGDVVYKPGKDDTLKLIHNGRTFAFTFDKF